MSQLADEPESESGGIKFRRGSNPLLPTQKIMIVLICGDRNWADRQKVVARLAAIPDGATIIHGACRGADCIAGEESTRRGFSVKEFPADWEKYGKSAGPIRNDAMLAEKPDLVIAFHPNLAESKGTADTVRKARAIGIPVDIIL